MGKYEQALADFDHAIALDEKDASAIASRGETYRLMGKYEQALTDFDHAIQLDEKDIWVIQNHGRTCLRMGKYEQALIDFNKVLEIDPENIDCMFWRALTNINLNNQNAANDDFNAVFVNTDYSIYRASALAWLGRHDEALAELAEASEDEFFTNYESDDDNLFGPIHDRPEYKRLINKTKGDSAETPSLPPE